MISLNHLTYQMSKSQLSDSLQSSWTSNASERWDFASTECVADITPIIGHLWLQVAANNCQTRLAIKLANKGNRCGVVDILQTGGWSFPTNPQAILQQARASRGVISQINEELALVNTILRENYQDTNLLHNIIFTYASILSQQISIGCTHSIVDVKLGKRTNVIAPWMTDVQLKQISKNFSEDCKQKLVIYKSEWLEAFQAILVEAGAAKPENLMIKNNPWIVQNCQGELADLVQVRWLLTNGSMPQCRAIGRQLILLHINELISGNDNLLTGNNNEYQKLYCQILPRICGANANWNDLQTQWNRFQNRLPKVSDFIVRQYLKNDRYEELEKSYGDPGNDLNIISFGLFPYHLADQETTVLIKEMNASYLDKLFEWLCRGNTYDPEVGIWLHKLPGEEVQALIRQEQNTQSEKLRNFKKLASIDQWQEPVISIFYRPSICSESEVMAKVRQFLCQGVNI